MKPRPQRRNANRHTQRGMQALETSIATDGWIGAITVAADGETFDGSARVEKTAENGMLDEPEDEDPIVIKAQPNRPIRIESDGTSPIIHIRKDIPNAQDERAVRLGIAANRVAELNLEWEPDVLAGLADVDLSSLFTPQEFAELSMPVLPEPGGGGDEFDPTPDDGPTRTQLGQLWIIGGVHRLLVGDCTDAANVARLMDGERAALCVTDPPYMVNYDPQWRVGVGGGGTQEYANGSVIANDDNLEWLGAFDNTPYDVVYIWMASTTIARLQPYLEERDFVMRYLIIWNKDLAAFGRGDYHWKHEVCLYMVRKGATGNWQGGHDQKTVWDIPTIHSFANGHSSEEWGLEGHGNQKPVECMQRPIENNSAAGQLIYDPFLGSGTTLIAAHRTGRRCYGMEISPRYCDVILRRASAEGLECTLIDG